MKIAIAERQIERFSTQKENHFSIKATGKAFKILSSGLYKEKILAIVRELSCNAYDAHVDAGKSDIPFTVHLPNSMEPFFSIRDYGKGLSDHLMRTVYTTYFESTKTDDNNQIGGLGLGCKSPLCYVDSFTVASVYDGVRRTYTVFFDETDTPSITLMSEETSNEPTGLEVKLPVTPNSFSEFYDKAKQVYRYFPVHPNIFGQADYKKTETISILRGSNFDICDDGGYRAKAIMGVVAYPLDYYAIPELKRNDLAQRLLNMRVNISFPVGDLDITAGREELSYDQRTKNNIALRVNEILSEIPDLVLEKINECESEMQARIYYGRVVKDAIQKSFPNGQVMYRGILIDKPYFELSLKKDYPDLIFYQYEMNYNNRIRITEDSIKNYGDTALFRIPAQDNLKIIIDDLGNRTILSRIRRYIKETPSLRGSKVIVVRVATGYDANNENLLKMTALLEGAEFIKMSDLPKQPPVPRSPVSAKKMDNWWGHYNYKKSEWWDESSVSPCDGGFYVKMKGSQVLDQKDEVYNELRDFLKNAQAIGVFEAKPIHGFPKSIIKDFVEEEDNEWIEVFSYIREKFEEKSSKENWLQIIAQKESTKKFTRLNNNDFSVIKKVAAKLDTEHPIRKFYDYWNLSLIHI